MDARKLRRKLEKLGWKYDKGDFIGDRSFTKVLDDGKMVQLLPESRKHYQGGIEFTFDPMLSETEFLQTRNLVLKEEREYVPLIARFGWLAPPIEKGVPEKIFPELTEEIVDELLAETLDWASYQDIDKAIDYYAGLPTNCWGIAPGHHITALVMRNNKEKLLYYQKCFAEGNRLRFAAYITDEVINRAVDMVMKK
ncbi:DUF6990 domain-containing protein [Basilea psittacipulmonis]|uniref:Uncharacterized protein n=2 Tax=Basilea TaxID=1472344 RepID=A0A077DI83_9BURK|nr:hypothetical protein [Basilea psittacipulmonis]AIL33217.1 hypothetical protein IX83_07835 [Basilea psittacipulmonis DSM 24701]